MAFQVWGTVSALQPVFSTIDQLVAINMRRVQASHLVDFDRGITLKHSGLSNRI